MNKFVHSVKHLIHEMIPPATFFFISFHLLAFTRALMLRQYGIEVTTFITATISALVAAKVVLLADLLPFINRFPGRPLIYNITWKATIYFLAAGVVCYLEKFIHFYRQAGQIGAANRRMLDEVIWPHFLANLIWLGVLLVVYCTMHELVRTFGRQRVQQVFFGVSGKVLPPTTADAVG